MKRFLIILLGMFVAPAWAQGHDMNAHWQQTLARGGGLAVGLAAAPNGTLWRVEARGGHLWVSSSRDGGAGFTEPVKVNAEPEPIMAEGQNRPQLALTRVGGAEVIALAWSSALPKLHTSRLRFTRSTDGGRSFEAPRTLNDDGNDAIGHSFAALRAGRDGALALAWIDGRAAAAARAAVGGRREAYAGSAIYFATSNDGGKSFGPNRKLADHSCECCRLALALDPDGTPRLLWRHLFDGARDFALAPLRENAPLARASTDAWAINACPHHGGDLASAADGSRHWVWFTGAADKPGLFYRQQRGAALSPPLAFGDLDAQPGQPTLWVGGRQVFLAWREFDGQAYRLRSQRSQDGGASFDTPRTIATSTAPTDAPLFVRDAPAPLLAWNREGAGLQVFNLEQSP